MFCFSLKVCIIGQLSLGGLNIETAKNGFNHKKRKIQSLIEFSFFGLFIRKLKSLKNSLCLFKEFLILLFIKEFRSKNQISIGKNFFKFFFFK